MVGFLISIPALASTSILRSGLLEHLITRRSQVQVLSLHPKKLLGLLTEEFFVVCKCRNFECLKTSGFLEPDDGRITCLQTPAAGGRRRESVKGQRSLFLREKCASKKKAGTATRKVVGSNPAPAPKHKRYAYTCLLCFSFFRYRRTNETAIDLQGLLCHTIIHRNVVFNALV